MKAQAAAAFASVQGFKRRLVLVLFCSCFCFLSLLLPDSKFTLFSAPAPCAWCGQAIGAENNPALLPEAESSEAQDKELEQIIKKVFLAYGGKEAFAKMASNCLSVGEQKSLLPAGEPKLNRFRSIRKGEALRLDLESEGGWVSTVYDGVRAFRIEGKLVKDLSADETDILSKEKDREPAVLTHYAEANYKFTLRGNTLHKAIPVYAIEVSRSGNPATTVYIDKKNYLVLAISYPAVDLESKAKATITIEYEEYRPSAGTLIAFKQLQSVNEQPSLETSMQSVELGVVKEDDDSFRRPDRPNEVRLDKPVTIPVHYTHKELLVKVRVNGGEPVDFLFDTGANQTLIDRRLAAENLLRQQSGMQMSGAAGLLYGQASEIPKLELGELLVPNVQAVIVDLSAHSRQLGKPIAGVIGANVINRFAVSIDYGKSTITFRDYASFKAPPGANVIAFQDKKGPVIKVLLNGKDELPCLVDTGAAFNNLPTAIGKKYQSGQTLRLTEGLGADGKAVRLGTIQIASVKAGSSVVRDLSFTYAYDETGKKGVIAESKQGILGNPFFQNFIMTVDYRMRQIILQANPFLASRQLLEQLVSTGDSKLNVYRDYKAADAAYQQALNKVQFLGDPRQQARIWGRLGCLRRIMSKDLGRPEQARVAYEYFSKARELANKMEDREIEGRVLADWALLSMDSGQMQEAQQSLELAATYAPQDPQVMVDFAVFLNKSKRYGEMRYYIDKALFLEPSNWQALWYRLKLCETFNDIAAQKETLKEILKYYSWSKLAQDKLAALNNPAASPAPGNASPSAAPLSPSTPTGRQ